MHLLASSIAIEEMVITPVLLQGGYLKKKLIMIFSNLKGENIHYFCGNCEIFSNKCF